MHLSIMVIWVVFHGMMVEILFIYLFRSYRAYYADTMSSDTSSAYSGSDTMHSLQSGQEELDLSGIHEYAS